MAENQEEFLNEIKAEYAQSPIKAEAVRVFGFDVRAQQSYAPLESRVSLAALRVACELPSQGRLDLLLDIDPYSLLVLAQQIQQQIDPAKQFSS